MSNWIAPNLFTSIPCEAWANVAENNRIIKARCWGTRNRCRQQEEHSAYIYEDTPYMDKDDMVIAVD